MAKAKKSKKGKKAKKAKKVVAAKKKSAKKSKKSTRSRKKSKEIGEEGRQEIEQEVCEEVRQEGGREESSSEESRPEESSQEERAEEGGRSQACPGSRARARARAELGVAEFGPLLFGAVGKCGGLFEPALTPGSHLTWKAAASPAAAFFLCRGCLPVRADSRKSPKPPATRPCFSGPDVRQPARGAAKIVFGMQHRPTTIPQNGQNAQKVGTCPSFLLHPVMAACSRLACGFWLQSVIAVPGGPSWTVS